MSASSWVAVLALAFALSPSGSLAAPDSPPRGTGITLPQIDGWTLTVTRTVYTRDNLWDLIDGAADLFLAYEFVDLTIGEYTQAHGTAVRVEVYRHASMEDAFGMYAAERQSDYSFISIGTQGYAEEGILNFLAGEFYVKLNTQGAGVEGSRALTQIAGRMARHLDRRSAWPEGLRLLPPQDRLPNTEGFVRRDFLGYARLGPAFTARYRGTPEVMMFVIAETTATAAKQTGEGLLKDAGARGGFSHDGVAAIDDPNNGPLTVLLSGKYLSGLVGAVTAPQRDQYLRTLRQTLNTAP